MIARLSADDLRAHYIYYSTIAALLRGTDVQVYHLSDLTERGNVFIPWVEFARLMGLTGEPEIDAAFSSTIYSLKREGLIGFTHAGHVAHLKSVFPDATEDGMIIQPTVPGIQLYLWALGRGQMSAAAITDRASDLPVIAEFGAVQRARRCSP